MNGYPLDIHCQTATRKGGGERQRLGAKKGMGVGAVNFKLRKMCLFSVFNFVKYMIVAT